MFSFGFLERLIKSDISKWKALAVLSFIAACAIGVMHYRIVSDGVTDLESSFPIFIVEAVLILSSLLFYCFMIQSMDFLKRRLYSEESFYHAESDPIHLSIKKEIPMKAFGAVIAVLVVMFGLGWIVQGNDFFMYKFFAPKYEDARRQVFENTKSYNQGMIQELQNMQFDYAKTADPKAKEALASIILHRAADFPEDRMPYDLAAFIKELKQKRMSAN